ncbi:cryptochrome DASH-like isoform A [Micractinium conductrix]|uniref:Cryptochrome DASH-like isoform A n=1 Tax=Micractinium conductrix TaxID=554055 RepID=A0A2P6VD71_9CHLO|nr:cryptochrome DASH-like isoform A [Micractinium conductrix]|eukprot:PSC72038.1 cryptochrome DASH-like isoform A [Micractinium conductrix]
MQGQAALARCSCSSSPGVPTLGPYRLRLLLEAAATLRGDLRRLGSDLLWSQGTPEALVGRLVALAVGAGATRLALHHYSQPGRGSADLERTVAAAFAAAAARQGVPTSVQRYWGSTLHHPDDLPFAALLPQRAAASAGSCADGSSGGAANARSQQQELQHPQQQQQQQQQPAAGSASGGGVDLQQDRFACLPSVMSDFRRELLQARTPVRPPLSPPLAADGSSSSSGSSCGGSTVASAPVLPPLPAGLAAEAAAAGLAAPLPTQVAAVYAAAGPAAAAALARWEELSGQRCADLAPAGSGAHDPRSAVPFGMGEAAGLRRLRHFVGLDAGEEAAVDDHSVHGKRAADQPPPLAGYQDSRMLAFGVDTSAKLSAFLSMGCLSPRTVYAEVLRLAAADAAAEQPQAAAQQQQGEQQRQRHQQQQQGEQQAEQQAEQLGVWRDPQRGDTWRWLLMHLTIRDYFIFLALKEGEALERAEGLAGRPVTWQHDAARFKRWTLGQTGLPFVDACMRELAATGYTSNRGRQNVADFLTKALGLDWRWGAQWYESLLGDHDLAVNLGNWAYNSGVGSDPRDRTFRTVSQGQRYDPEAALVRAWVPELAALQPAELSHTPWEASPEALAAAGVVLGEAGSTSPGSSSGGGGGGGVQTGPGSHAGCGLPFKLANFQGLYECTDSVRVGRPASLSELRTLVSLYPRVKAVGTGHSYVRDLFCTGNGSDALDIVMTELQPVLDLSAAVPVDPQQWQGRGAPPDVPIRVDEEAETVMVATGVTQRTLLDYLAGYTHGLSPRGWTLPVPAGFIDQTMGGAVATGTHGSSMQWGSLSSQLAGLQLVLANGTLLELTPQSNPHLFRAAAVSVGRLGVLTQLTFRIVRQQQGVQRTLQNLTVDAFIQQIKATADGYAEAQAARDEEGVQRALRQLDEAQGFWAVPASYVLRVDFQRPDGEPAADVHANVTRRDGSAGSEQAAGVPAPEAPVAAAAVDRLGVLAAEAPGPAAEAAVFPQTDEPAIAPNLPMTSSAAFWSQFFMAALAPKLTPGTFNSSRESFLTLTEAETKLIGTLAPYRQHEVVIPLERAGTCLQQVAAELYGPNQAWEGMRTPWVIRFVRGEDPYLSPTAGGPVMWINLDDYVSLSSGTPNAPFERVVELLRAQCGGRLHWGKEGWTNHARCFDGASEYAATWCSFGCAAQELGAGNKFASEFAGWRFAATRDGQPAGFASCCTPAGFSQDCRT